MAYLSSWKWLLNMGPGYAIPGSRVKVLANPETFYSVLLEKTKSAKNRVSLASLYIGNGHLEKQLIGALQKNLEGNSGLEVKILLDFSRGSRGEGNSRTLLIPLLSTSDSCQVFLYHTPTLRGMLKKCLPQRWNEIIGLQHMKIYIFDNSLVISGANLSNDYFTNRQDRYVLVENCEALANFYDGLIKQVSTFSFRVNADNQLSTFPGWTVDPISGDFNQFVKKANETVMSYYDSHTRENSVRLESLRKRFQESELQPKPEADDKEDTWIFPLIQMGPLNIQLDNLATSKIFEEAPQGANIKLATGYFNLTSDYVDKIIARSKADFDILMAHPQANGFLGARGAAGGIPAAYTELARMFYSRVKSTNAEKRIAMWEYARPGWTFHAKGLWYYCSRSDLPLVTLIGSPNFGHRSVYRDLETQMYIITENEALRKDLHDEQRRLFQHSKCFSDHTLTQPDRVVPSWVKLVIRFFRNFF